MNISGRIIREAPLLAASLIIEDAFYRFSDLDNEVLIWIRAILNLVREDYIFYIFYIFYC